jgi:uncharacterized iron-regulated membrane protein
MKPTSIRQLHRWTGLACALGLFMASASGILHVVMTWTQSAPPPTRPTDAIRAADLLISPAEALERLGGTPASAISLRLIGGEPWWQVLAPGSSVPAYISARDGREEAERDGLYAAEIASRYLGGRPVRWTRRLDSYDREYIPIFRLLPVHRLDVDDGQGTRLYVSTLTGSVARHTDNGRQREANLFSLLHKYQFIPAKGARDLALVTVTALMLITSVGGLWLFFATRRGARKS